MISKKTYKIAVFETLVSYIEIEAENEETAIADAKHLYYDEGIDTSGASLDDSWLELIKE